MKKPTRPKRKENMIRTCQSCGDHIEVKENPASNEEVVVLKCFSCNGGNNPIIRYQLKLI